MASFGHVAIGGVVALLLWTLIGLPIALRFPGRVPAITLAPIVGWAIYSVLALPLFALAGMGRPVVAAVALLSMLAAAWMLWTGRRGEAAMAWPPLLVMVALLAAAALALAPMAAILPKVTAEGIALSSPIFDHSKIGMIDEMIRSGVYATNPFFSEIGQPDRLSYYYLWHFSAAMLAVLTGISGWEADAAMSWFTAFGSLSVMAGFAAMLGGRNVAALWAVALAATGSARTVLSWLIGEDRSYALVWYATGFGGWLFQTSWAPQHVASAAIVVVTCFLLPKLATSRGPFLPVVVGLTAAAGYQSSTWVGGITFALAAVVIGLFVLLTAEAAARRAFVVRAILAGAIAAVLAAPFLFDQMATTALRDAGSPVTIAHVHVFGGGIPDAIRRLADLPGYWLVYLPLEFIAFYPAGLIAMLFLLRHSLPEGERNQAVRTFALVVAASLMAAWLLVSTVGSNNDLGWRAVLPAALLLIAFAAAGLARWTETRARLASVLALGALAIGLVDGGYIIRDDIGPYRSASEPAFARTPAMWAAVRRHVSPNERVANNPLFLEDLTPWPVNISWALLADRRSCYAGSELALPFAPVSIARRAEIDALFVRVFAGEPQAGDLAAIADRYRCDAVVVTAKDGAWGRDPFAASDRFRLVDSDPAFWRIYRVVRQP